MKKIIITLFIIISFSFSQKVVSSNWTSNIEKSYKPELEVILKIQQKKYDSDQPILVDVQIKNISNSSENITLKLKNDLSKNFKFTLTNERNTPINPSMNYLSRIQNNFIEEENEFTYQFSDELKTKNIELAYNDIFTTQINLNTFFDIKEGVNYFLSGDFILEIPINDTNSIQIKYPLNQIFFSTQGESTKNENNITFSEKEKQNKNYSNPEKIIQLFLETQKNKDWKNHLFLINLLKLLNNSYSTTTIYERFISSNKNEKNFILHDFKDMLIKSYDYSIKEFEIEETHIKKDLATVKANAIISKNVKKWEKNLNPINHQIEKNWYDIPYAPIDNNITFIFRLKKNSDHQWKIIQKNVKASVKKQIFSSQVEKSPLSGEIKEVIYFDIGKYEIHPQYYSVLENLRDYIQLNPNYRVILRGYTDLTGSKNINLTLSKKRAYRIEQYLVNKLGVSSKIITTNWFGSKKPTSINYSLNRRVEIIVTEQ